MIRLLLIAGLLLAWAAEAAESIRIGLSVPMSGRYKEQGQEQSRGALLAVDQINTTGGVLGKPLELLIGNTASKAEKTEETIRELTGQGAVFLLGAASSDAALAASREAASAGRIFVGAMGYANNLTNEDASRYFFRETYNAHMAAKALSSYLNRQLQGKKLFYVTANYAWGWSTEESLRAFTNSVSRDLHPGVLVNYPRPRHGDFENALKQADASGADVLMLIQFGDDMATALEMATRMGLKNKMTIVVPNLTLAMAKAAGAEVMSGVIGAVPWYWEVPYQYGHPAGQAFVKTFVERYGEYPSSAAASAYSIVMQFRDAASRAGSTDSDKLIRALEGYSYTGLKDTQVWRALDHQNQQSVYVVQGKPRDEVVRSELHSSYFTILQALTPAEVALEPDDWKALRRNAGKADKL